MLSFDNNFSQTTLQHSWQKKRFNFEITQAKFDDKDGTRQTDFKEGQNANATGYLIFISP